MRESLLRLSRRAKLLIAALALVSLWCLYSFSGEPSIRPVKAERVVVYERAIHDEVTGAIAASLTAAGIFPTYVCSFRFKFEEIMGRITAPHVPEILNPWVHKNEVENRLDRDEIDTLILTTCQDALPVIMPHLLKSSAKVICVVHHSGPWAYHHDKPHIAKLIHDRRIVLVTLGEHVRASLQDDALQWAEGEEDAAWLDVPIFSMNPTFDEPGPGPRAVPVVFPSRAVMQGNIEPGRRRYDKVLADLKRSMLENPALWGYDKIPGETALVQREDAASSPFSLHLVGQTNKDRKIGIPPELVNVVEIHEDLSYPDFYHLLHNTDIMIPAFAVPGTYKETASSTMATSVVVRVPVLVTDRHLAAYTYIDEPGYIKYSIAESEVAAIARLRQNNRNSRPRASDSEWNRYQLKHTRENVEMWRASVEFLHGKRYS